MNVSEILKWLKKESLRISNEDLSLARAAVMEAVIYVPKPYRSIYSSDYFAFLYESFLELQRCYYPNCEMEEIDDKALEDLLSRIGREGTNNSKKEAFSRFASIVLIYLTFVSKKPLHPTGMIFPGGMKITHKEPYYYCPAKGSQSDNDLSFCEFCICRDSEEFR